MALAAALAPPGWGQPRPQDLREQLHGRAVVTRSGSSTTITTSNGAGTRHSAFDWRSFQVPEHHGVFFTQPDAGSLSINRVLGGERSDILGTLGSNGKLVLVNPAGIVFGRNARVDTAGFTASTLGMTRDDAIAGRLRFGGPGSLADFRSAGDDDDDGGNGSGRIRVDKGGRIVAKNGDVVLIAPDIDVREDAVVEAEGGDVVLAAGRRVEITGRGIEAIRMELRAPGDRAVNLGTLKGDSVAIFAGRLRHSGLVQARSASVEGGKVLLHATDEGVIDGRIEASNAARGGFVQIVGERLLLKTSTFIDVRHANGGGEIRIEGERVEVEEGVQLRADVTLKGGGGTLLVESSQPQVPRTVLPEVLQAALRKPEDERDAYLSLKLQPLGSEPEQPGLPRVKVTAVQCTVTR